MALDRKEKEKWEKTVKEGVFFLVGIEIRAQRKQTLINMLRHFNGNVKGIPSIEKGMANYGKFANRTIIEEFLKTQGDLCLLGAPDDIIDDIVLEDGHLHKYIKDLFVDAYFKTNYVQIVHFTKNWDTVKSILNCVKTH